MHTHMNACTHACTTTYTHAHTHTHTCTCAHTQTHTRTCTHTHTGQFWSLPISIERNGSDPTYYLIEVPQSGNQRRRFIGDQHSVTWQGETRKCFYVGDSQGAKGAWQHEGPNDPVIEGTYSDYITNGRFDTNFEFSQFGK